MSERQTYSIQEIKDRLLAQVESVVYRYAPQVQGSHRQGEYYFTLNPGRVDRHVSSFYVRISGPRAGQWADKATGDYGDILDLIRLSMGCDAVGAIKEARALLGLEHETPEVRRQRERAAEQARERRRQQAAEDREQMRRRSRAAHALWLSGRAQLGGTPVELYLRDRRGIDLRALGRQPRALRYVPECRYTHTDPETGEVIEGVHPAMVAIVTDAKGQAVACHRTYLGINPDGRWDKADLPAAKKVLGNYAGASIHLWRGIGPRGGKPAPLHSAPDGSRVFIAEGIEDALSAIMLIPDQRVIAAISLGNLGAVVLPPAITDVTLIADQDENDQARAALARAVEQHQKAGRRVRIWQNRHGGKDLNDALRAQAGRGSEQGAA